MGHELRPILRALRANEFVAFLADQDAGADGIFVTPPGGAQDVTSCWDADNYPEIWCDQIKAQDRAIRAEENLRHFAMTGKLLDSRLTIRQIIGLRFASDEEFILLAKKAVDENLSEDAIKRTIKVWRGDFHRV